MDSWTFVSRDPEETRAVGRELGRSIGADGVIVALVGPLGAGKTVFVKGLAEGLGVDPRRVSSPTFVIAQQYPLPDGPHTLHHVDLYRLEAEDELVNIGFDDMFAGGSVLAVEWADRFPGVLGGDCLRIELEGPSLAEAEGTDRSDGRAPGPGRRAVVSATGRDASRVAADWFERIERRAVRAGDAAGFERLSALVPILMVGLALTLSAVEAADLVFGGGTDCPRLVEREADAFGTRVATCEATPPRDAREASPRGVGRLVSGQRIDVSRAPAAWLETLPGIGPARAEAIVGHRGASPFASTGDLERVPGIGPVLRARLAHFVTVGSAGEVDDGAG